MNTEKYKPIIFNGKMIDAILEGRKTQTRRVIKKPISEHMLVLLRGCRPCRRGSYEFIGNPDGGLEISLKPFAFPGDHLWIRETWADVNTEDGPAICYRANGEYQSWRSFSKSFGPDYGAGPSMDYDAYPGEYSMWWEDLLSGAPGHKWKSPLFMPRWASRIELFITDIRIERLQDISENDAIKEGFYSLTHFKSFWDEISGAKYQWINNPFVWVIEFKKS